MISKCLSILLSVISNQHYMGHLRCPYQIVPLPLYYLLRRYTSDHVRCCYRLISALLQNGPTPTCNGKCSDGIPPLMSDVAGWMPQSHTPFSTYHTLLMSDVAVAPSPLTSSDVIIAMVHPSYTSADLRWGSLTSFRSCGTVGVLRCHDHNLRSRVVPAPIVYLRALTCPM